MTTAAEGRGAGRVVLLTGASGFVGRYLAEVLTAEGWRVRRALRAGTPGPDDVLVGAIDGDTDWRAALAGVDAVVHAAGKAHAVDDVGLASMDAYRAVNTAGTLRLAEAAAKAGVRQLVFLSSSKVNGDTSGGAALTETLPVVPHGAYGVSKWEAEEGLRTLAARTSLAVTILRPPLMYGPGVKGNFLRLVRAVARGVPLPLGRAKAPRSLLFVGNLSHAIATVLAAAPAGSGTWFLTDGPAVPVATLLREVGAQLGRPARLVPVPLALLRLGGRLIGRSADVGRLLDPFVLDDAAFRARFAWHPPYTLAEGLARTIAWYRKR